MCDLANAASMLASMSTDDALLPGDMQRKPPGNARTERFRIAADGETRDRHLDRPVTLRSVPPSQADGLQAEARFLARMRGPGLPCVYEFINDDAGAAMVMPALSGLTLTAAVALRASGQRFAAIAGTTPCVLTGIAICNALHAAHLHGVVHGALTPDLIVLGDDGSLAIEGWNRAMELAERPLTRRFCADSPAAVPLAADDQYQDIRSLGVCLHTALAGDVLASGTDGKPLPPGDEAVSRVPAPLLAIIRKAVGSTPATGYGSIAAVRDDLLRYLDGQAPRLDAVEPSSRSWLRAAAIVLLILAVVGIGVTLNWRSVSAYATWGKPLVEEDFSTEAWKPRWGSRGRWKQIDGRLVSQSDYDCALILKQRLSPPVAIEYTGRWSSKQRAGDLSVWWCEGDPFALRPEDDIDKVKARFIQAGAYGNSWCCIWQTPERIRLQVNGRVLEPDRDYRFRVEILADRMAMWIDGELVMEHREVFPIGAGNIGLYTYDPGKSFNDVRIWQQTVPETVSPLVVGDESFRAERFADAADAYGRVAASHAGRPLGVEAIYFQGLAQHRQGAPEIARATWQALPDALLRWRADCLMIDDLAGEGRLQDAVARFTEMWQQRPQVHEVLRQRWQIAGQRMRSVRIPQKAAMEEWIRLRDATFPDDRASQWLVAEMLNHMHAWEETIRRFPDEHRPLARALIALGRNDEVIAATWALPAERVLARLGQGDLDGVLASPDLDRATRADLLCKMGRATEAVELNPALAAVYLGGFEDRMLTGIRPWFASRYLMALGRWEEAAGTGVPECPGSGGYPDAMLLLNRLDEVDKMGWDTRPYRLLNLLAAGSLEQAREVRQTYTFSRNRRATYPWFGHVIGTGLIDATLGDDGALRRGLEEGTKITGGWGDRPRLVCAAALDPAAEPALLAMPWRSEVDGWLLVARAVRAELARDTPTALAQWRAFKALPHNKRLLEGHTPCIQLEAFTNWRIAALAAAP